MDFCMFNPKKTTCVDALKAEILARQRNSGYYGFFSTPPPIGILDDGFILEDGSYDYLGTEEGFRISEE